MSFAWEPPYRPPTRENQATAQMEVSPDGRRELHITFPRLVEPFRVFAVCERCKRFQHTGATVARRDLPLSASGGRWRCQCGGSATLPDRLTLMDATTREEVVIIRSDRGEITVSAITLAELLRLSQTARAVQAGRPGADEKFERVLNEAPEPIRQIAERWKISDKLQLAGIIVAIVLALLTYMKDDGAVTEQQLVDLVEKVLEQESGGEQQQAAENPQGGADQAGPSEGARAVDGAAGERDGLPAAPDDEAGVEQPREEQQQP